MGRQIEPQAKQIILKVIQFCETEKKNGLLAPRNQAIKRACLATGLSKYTILKIRNEGRNSASIEGYEQKSEGVPEDLMSDDERGGDMEPGESTGVLHNSNSYEAAVSGVAPPSSAMETVLVKIEAVENDQEDSTPTGVSFNVKCEYESDPEYDVPLKKPQEECDDNHSTVVKCEFESTDDPLMPASEQEDYGASTSKNHSCNKENSSKKKHASASNQTQSTGRYECHICHKQLSALSKLKSHVTLAEDKPFTCTVCQSKYSHKKGLQRHMKTHTDKQYECSICKKRFKENSKLNRHLKSHTGEKRFGCHLCERRFIRNEELQIHIRTHTGEKPYECSICHTKFTQKITLQKHLRTHTGKKTHKCSICHSWFACSSSLQVHSRIHTGEKPYVCSLCPSRFAQSIHLLRHLRRHGIGEKQFECDICHSRYNEKYQLRAHIKTH